VLFHDIIIEMPDGAFCDHRTAVHDVKAVADFEAKIEILLDQQDADLSLSPDFFKCSPMRSMMFG